MTVTKPSGIDPSMDPDSEYQMCISRLRGGGIPENLRHAHEILDGHQTPALPNPDKRVESNVTIAPDIIVVTEQH